MMQIGDGMFVGTLVLLMVKVAAVFVAAELIVLALRRASAASRHLVWSAAIGGALLLPVLALLLPHWNVPLVSMADGGPPAAVDRQLDAGDHAPGTAADSAGSRDEGEPAPAVGAVPPGVAGPSTSEGEPAFGLLTGLDRADLAAWFGWAWLIGLIAVAGRIALGAWGARQLVARGHEASAEWNETARGVTRRLGLGRSPRLVASPDVDMPMAWGVTRPVVLLPASSNGWSEQRRQLVLTHEFAHIRRRDCLTQLVAHAVCAFYWLNPLAWRAAARMRSEREKACDDMVLTSGTAGSEYAQHLLEIARRARGGRAAYAVALPMARPSQLEGRLLSILNATGATRALGTGWLVAVPLVTLAIVVPMAAFHPWAAAAEPASSPGERFASAPAPQEDLSAPTVEELAERFGSQMAESAALETLGRQLGRAVTEGAVSSLASALGPAARQSEPASSGARDRVLAAMLEVLSQGDDEMRADAAHALGNMEDPRAVEPLVAALQDPEAATRSAAAWALGMIESDAAVAGLVRALEDSDTGVAEHAAWALGMIESDAAVPGILAAASQQRPAVLSQLAWALGMIESADGVPALMTLASSDDEDVRAQSAWALGMIEHVDAVPVATVLLTDTVESVRTQAAWALGMIESPEGVDALIAALRDDSAEVRATAAWALGMIEDERALDALLDAMKDSDRDVQRAAMDAVSMIAR